MHCGGCIGYEFPPLPCKVLSEFESFVDVCIELNPNLSTSGFQDALRSEVK